jgi:hypothetical protein
VIKKQDVKTIHQLYELAVQGNDQVLHNSFLPSLETISRASKIKQYGKSAKHLMRFLRFCIQKKCKAIAFARSYAGGVFHCSKNNLNLKLLIPSYGALAQLVERNNGIVEANGSTPLRSIS